MPLSLLVLVLGARPLALEPLCLYNFSAPHRSVILSGYAKGYDPKHQPYPNSLSEAQAWCCQQGPSICGGITHQAGLFDARAGCAPRQCSHGCANVTSWVLEDATHPCRSPPQPPKPGGGKPPVDIPVWPVPKTVHLPTSAGSTMTVSDSFVIKIPPNAPDALISAKSRYEQIIRAAAKMALRIAAPGELSSATVDVTDMGATLNFDTNYSYSLALTDGQPAVHAETIFGAMYGLESLAQLMANGTVDGTLVGLTIEDDADYRYRGLMIDTGRRFVPKADILNSLEAMSATKMNVLHMHLSDDQRCAVDSVTFPNLTGHLKSKKQMAGSYKHKDIQDIIAFANQRGILVIPEIDLPGHANGLLPLKESGVTFCADSQMYADKTGKTNAVLIELIKEYAELFGSQTFHLGCDETTVKPPLCTLSATKAVEVAVSEAVHGLLHNGNPMWPMGWEEFHWRTNASNSVGPGPNGAIIEAWSKYKAADVVRAGYRAVEADGGKFYLNHLHPTDSQWSDIGVGIESDEEKALMLGGEICMWTLEYRAGACNPDDKHGCGITQFGPSTDAIFSKSFGGIIWPRAAVGAASFWNFNASWAFEDLEPRYLRFAAVLESRGLHTCPAKCAGGEEPQCDYGFACGVPYV